MAIWKVEYGPFNDDVILLVAKSWGWEEQITTILPKAKSPTVIKNPISAIDYVTEKMKQFNIEKLSQAKIDYELKEVENQSNNIRNTVKDSISKVIKIEVIK